MKSSDSFIEIVAVAQKQHRVMSHFYLNHMSTRMWKLSAATPRADRSFDYSRSITDRALDKSSEPGAKVYEYE